MRWFTVILLALGVFACVDYSGEEGPTCENHLDCNPGRTCGQLIACDLGFCQDEASLDVPCAQQCQDHGDCQAGMHCVWSEVSPDTGYCRLDGICDGVDECQEHVEPGTCSGSFACEDRVCRWNCDA